MRVSFHATARRELLKYSQWYQERSESAATGFEQEIEHAIMRVAEAPERYPLTLCGRRRFVLIEYPFDLIYRVRDNEIQVMAVAHHSRRPGYWARRS